MFDAIYIYVQLGRGRCCARRGPRLQVLPPHHQTQRLRHTPRTVSHQGRSLWSLIKIKKIVLSLNVQKLQTLKFTETLVLLER